MIFGLPLNPAAMALSMAPEIAWPEICAITGVAAICISRSLMLSGDTDTDWTSTAEVLAVKSVSPP
jgi:hypothetical protein